MTELSRVDEESTNDKKAVEESYEMLLEGTTVEESRPMDFEMPKNFEDMKEDEEMKEDRDAVVKDEKMEGAEEDQVEKSKEVEMEDAIWNRKCVSSHTPMDPNHCFHNRRHPESFINISKEDYSKLNQGKTLRFCNSRSRVIMSIRVLSSQKITTKERENQVDNLSLPIPNLVSEFKEEVGDNFNYQSLNQCAERSHFNFDQPEGDDTIQPSVGTPKVENSPSDPYVQGNIIGFQPSPDRTKRLQHFKRVMRKKRVAMRTANISSSADRRISLCHFPNSLCRCKFKVEVIEDRDEYSQAGCFTHPKVQSGMKRRLYPISMNNPPNN